MLGKLTMPILVRWVKPRGAKKFKVTITEKGRIEHHVVDGIIIDSGFEIKVSGVEGSRGWVTTYTPCRIVEVESLPGIKEKILACTKKSLREIKESIKFM